MARIIVSTDEGIVMEVIDVPADGFTDTAASRLELTLDVVQALHTAHREESE